MGAAHEAIADEADADWFCHDGVVVGGVELKRSANVWKARIFWAEAAIAIKITKSEVYGNQTREMMGNLTTDRDGFYGESFLTPIDCSPSSTNERKSVRNQLIFNGISEIRCEICRLLRQVGRLVCGERKLESQAWAGS